MNFLIIISLLVFLGISIYRKEWGLYLIILGLPTYQVRFTVFSIPVTFLESMILLLAVAVSLRGTFKNKLLQFIHHNKFTFVLILMANNIFLNVLLRAMPYFLIPAKS